ncbi:MAG: aminoacetone oxidase family FAD-binding enzyme [Castellaniella sp.]|uniref:NAD(P)/FAD-dependent oxidoreductase n=1 Tax=Castellaniella sp. TaxID=1955812 RepID=UPI002A3587E0|nr:aminoacetone oxidase family FAD-binding enzyme [Castellaniella sp.]MDY0308818.1 aminoacetone oxidase family FAD-binding enzyme [Castellaniella sp.]
MSGDRFDVAVVGAGAAGMMAAAVAAQRGLRVVLIDHAARLAEKIRISGGGRCNFTNLGASPAQFLSRNPDFCRSALRAYGPGDFLDLLRAHRVSWHEKHRGQLFCDDSSESIIQVLRRECEAGGVRWRMPCAVRAVGREADGFRLDTDAGPIHAARLVLATGGMAIPQLGATDFSLRIARQFGLKIVEPRPALVPLIFDADQWRPYGALAGVSLEVRLSHEAAVIDGGGKRSRRPARAEFLEDLLFTHRGLSGPGILQLSSYWRAGDPIRIDLSPGRDMAEVLVTAKPGNRQTVAAALAQVWPRRLAEAWLGAAGAACKGARADDLANPGGSVADDLRGLGGLRLADAPDRRLRALAEHIHGWMLCPTGTAGYKKAEVMSGGVDTDELDQRSLESRRCPGLHVIGEAVDVTGWLGGYNFQWAWSSGVACGRALAAAG